VSRPEVFLCGLTKKKLLTFLLFEGIINSDKTKEDKTYEKPVGKI
jgi:hypothetical protein